MNEHERTIKSGINDPQVGTVTSVRGSVVDASFPGKLPPLHNLLRTGAVSYTHLRAHETVLDLVCRLLLEKKNSYTSLSIPYTHIFQS